MADDQTEHECHFSRSFDNRKFILAHRRKRLNSAPTRFLQTDHEIHHENTRKNLRDLKGCEPWNNGSGETKRGRPVSCTSTLLMGVQQLQHQRKLKDKVTQTRKIKHENIYRGLLRSLLHPLGAPDDTVGLRPGDLLDHLREVFEVDHEDHELYIMEESPHRPYNMQVNIVVLEANGLRSSDFSEDICNCYCLLTLHHPTRGKSSLQNSPKNMSPRLSPRNSHRSSPMTSPEASPRLLSRNGSPQHSPRTASPMFGSKGNCSGSGSLDSEVLRTSTIKNCSHPKWNEEFTLDIEDYLTDEIQIFLCDHDQQVKQEKHHSVKNFLSVLKHSNSSDGSDGENGYVGKITIPIREIAALGSDDWYDIMVMGAKGRTRAIGKCHLKMGISYKQDFEDVCQFSSEDYYQAYRQFLQYTYRKSKASRSIADIYGSLTLKDHRILQMFAEAHRISKLSQAIVNVICLLEMQSEEGYLELGEGNLHVALDNLRMTWATMQIGQKNLLDRMPLTDIEISNYRKVAAKYIHQKGDIVFDLPELFPPTLENLNIMKSKLSAIVQLLGLDLWQPDCEAKKEISEKIVKKLQEDASRWIDEELGDIEERSPEIKDKVLPEIERLTNLVDVVNSHCTVLPVLKQFYHNFSINYYRLVSFAVEKKISTMCVTIMEKMNTYKKRYNSYPVNIMLASRQTLRLYFSTRKLHLTIRDNISRRDVFRLNIHHYQEWFEVSMVYWLQTFKSECIQRMEKALEIDKDVVVVTNLVKYSHSSVDVLSCFSQVIEEWRKIDFRDPDCAVIGVTKITDIICDGARLYAEKIHTILERNCYYDDKLNAEFDVNDRLCITLNNIEHVRMYLSGLPSLLAWDNVVMMISTRYDNDSTGNQALATLQRLVDLSNDEILIKSAKLLEQICEKMKVDIERYMEIFTKKEPKKVSSVDKFLGYLNTNLQTLNSQLMPDIYPYVNEQLWELILKSLNKQLLTGQQLDYYDKMKMHLRAITYFFQRTGLGEQQLYNTLYDDFKTRLDDNSKKSEELMLQYYNHLATDVVTPTECYGHLAFKAAYMEETRGNVTIYVTVLRGNDLPGLDASGYSDPYVEVSLQPHRLFGFSRCQKTHVVKQTLNPVFNITFQFPNVSKEALNKPGTCILFSVFDHDTIGRDDFAGEVVVHMPTILKIGMDKSMDRMPAIIMPLKRPKRPLEGPFTILAQRDWDKDAKKFIYDRSRFIDHQPKRTDKYNNAGKGFFSNFFANLS
ncbi:protein unc-13 homolog D-like [Mercenaria mercenaria]|uniref:protein unc-13 homolog D-like n=1 Tax=Mercenaria mercenaria TaxID=6596 RepID=UPI00234F6FB5|nr:protein unc-13 homolog D-like [Mercenaria mercenaria]